MEITDKILNQFAKSGKALKGGEIADLTGIDKKLVDKTLKKLMSEDKIYSPVRCYYDLKK
ncbi:MAG: MarR family transcriptional regulator [Bacteroidia bacterium]|nr:MarR family transcriptional regulator [Bacteroidia bacterium]